MSISDLAINPFNGCLEILDPWGKLLAFDLNGKYLHSFRLPKDLHAYDEFIPLSRDSIAFYSLSEPSTLNIYSRTTSKIVYSGFKSSKKLSISQEARTAIPDKAIIIFFIAFIIQIFN